MMTNTANVSAPMDIYVPSNDNPWNGQKINHLYRRLGFGASLVMVNEALGQQPVDLIDALIDEALLKEPTPAPEWANWIRDDFDNAPLKVFEYRNQWKAQTITDFFNNGLKDRMTLFWSNHFVTEDQSYNSPAYMFQYYNILQQYGLGNFKTLTADIGISNAMLIYLNGFKNNKNKPNENYARELYELFTLGVNNGYTQSDIEETARALTGWNDREKFFSPITFNPNKFDNGEKVIFGEQGNWGYDDVINLLFDNRKEQIANFICTKLYRYFVNPEVNIPVVAALANTFVSQDFEIAPVLKQLFKSEHFFDASNLGVIIKSPADLQVNFLKEIGLEFTPGFKIIDKIRSGNGLLGQELFRPVDVAGWQGDKDWISSSTLTGRWERLGWYLWRAYKDNGEQYRVFVKDLLGENSNDVEKVMRAIMDHFFAKKLFNEVEYSEALEIFKDQVPENYFEDGIWDLDWETVPKQVYILLVHLTKIPEFQLK